MSAKNELEFVRRVRHDAKGRSQRVDAALFEITPAKHRPRRGRGLTVSELYELALWAPEHASRLILLAGQVGCRQNVWFNLTDDMIDLKESTITIPAWLAKRRGEHRVYLTELEASLLREQLLARAVGMSLVFPIVEGKKWTASRFRDRVWVRTVEAAVKNGLDRREDAPSIFEGFTFHMLRHTAASLMAHAGMDATAAAERVEHSDGGALFHKIYRHLYEGEKRTQANRLQTLVQDALDEEGTAEDREAQNPRASEGFVDGRYWARTSDPQLVDHVPRIVIRRHTSQSEERSVAGVATVSTVRRG
ncbi:MAG: tyrosine-type recombinase/integrase [Gaiellaceae bacterium]